MSRRMWKAMETKVEEVRMAEEEKKEKEGKKQEKKKQKKKERKKPKKERIIEVKKIAEEWEIWNEEEEMARSKKEARKIVPECFHKWIQVFGKKASEWMPTKKL